MKAPREAVAMRAMLLDTPAPIASHPLRLADIATPVSGLGQLVMKVTACGVCRSNLHMIEGDWVANGVPAKSPIVPGHEVVGTVAEIGPGVHGFKVGDRVGVHPLWSSCLACEYCLSAREQLCPFKEITGESVDGGYAEYMLATAEHTYHVPDEISDIEAAPLFCPGITAIGAVSKARLAPGKRLALFGIGGVGHITLQLAKLYGAETTAVARSSEHLELATELGAVATVDSSQGDPGAALAALGGFDSAIVFAPSTEVLHQAIAAVKPGGVIVLGVFADIGSVPFPLEKTVVGSTLGSRLQMREVLQLAAEGKVRAHCAAYPLEEAQRALSDLKANKVRARAVLAI